MLFLNYSTIIDPFLRDVRSFVPEFAGMKAGDKALDICCGSGDQVFYYDALGINAFGIDLDPNMIGLAKKDKRNRWAKNVSFQVADAKKLPFEDDFFDFVSISLALHEKDRETRNKVISEMKRVAKKEGALIFVDFQIPFSGKFYPLLIKSIEYFAGNYHFGCFKDYAKQGGLQRLLAENGFKETKTAFLKNGNLAAIKTKP